MYHRTKNLTKEAYGDLERQLRAQAVEALRRHETQLFGKVKDVIIEEPKEIDEEVRSGRWTRAKIKVKMIRGPQQRGLDDDIDADDQRLADIEQRGRLIDEEYRRLKEEDRAESARNKQRYEVAKGNDDKDALIVLSYDQINFDLQMKEKPEPVYQKEKRSEPKQRMKLNKKAETFSTC